MLAMALVRYLRRPLITCSSNPILFSVNAICAGSSSTAQLIIVMQNTRQPRMQKADMSWASRFAVLSSDCSSLQPDFSILSQV
jgi:hypothetical protein